MGEEMTWLSYSGFVQYKNCPLHYKLARVDKQEPPFKESHHNAVIGVVVQKVFEDFYNDELWRRGEKTSEELLKRAELYYWEYLDQNYVNFDDVTSRFKGKGPTAALKEILDMVPKVLAGIKREKFLGPYAKSEVEIKVRFKGGNDILLGYLDFVIRRPDGTVIVLDGKASRHRDKYVEEDQLHFYALLFYLRYKVLPDKMAFFFYAFAEDPEQAVKWVEVDRERIKNLRLEIEEVIDNIYDRKFTATPSPSTCKFCPYQTECPARISQKNVRYEQSKITRKTPSIDLGNKPTGFIGFDDLK